MGQVLHGSATTTEAVRRAIQHSQESLRVPPRRLRTPAYAYGASSRQPVHPTRAQATALPPCHPRSFAHIAVFMRIYQFINFYYSNRAVPNGAPGFSGLPCRFPATPSIVAEWRGQVYDPARFFRAERAAIEFFP